MNLGQEANSARQGFFLATNSLIVFVVNEDEILWGTCGGWVAMGDRVAPIPGLEEDYGWYLGTQYQNF